MFPLDILGEPVWQRLTWTLLHFLWQGLAVVVVVATLLYAWPVRRAHNRHLIYLSALIAMAAIYGMIAPPINVPVMIIGGGVDKAVERLRRDLQRLARLHFFQRVACHQITLTLKRTRITWLPPVGVSSNTTR